MSGVVGYMEDVMGYMASVVRCCEVDRHTPNVVGIT